jgi:hypothetical protein
MPRNDCVSFQFRASAAGRVNAGLSGTDVEKPCDSQNALLFLLRWVDRRIGSHDWREPVALPRHPALLVARQAGSANVRPHRVDRTRGGDTNVPDQRGAAIAVATHAPLRVVDQRGRNARELGFVLGGEARPLPRIGAAGPAALAEGRVVHLCVAGADGEVSSSIGRRAVKRRRPSLGRCGRNGKAGALGPPYAARRISSASARYDRASARCTRLTLAAPSRSASVRATRKTRW